MNHTAFQETLFVRLADVKWYDADLAETIQLEWMRLEPYLRQAVQLLVRELDPDLVKDQDQNDREFYLAWEGIERIDRLRDLRSAKVRLAWKLVSLQHRRYCQGHNMRQMLCHALSELSKSSLRT